MMEPMHWPRRHPYQVTPPSKPTRRAAPRRGIDLSSSSRASDPRSLVSSPQVPGAQVTRRGILQCPSRCPTSTPCRFHEFHSVPLRETHVKWVALRVEQIAVCVAGFHLTHAPLCTKESLRGRWHIVNAYRAPKLVLQAQSTQKHPQRGNVRIPATNGRN